MRDLAVAGRDIMRISSSSTSASAAFEEAVALEQRLFFERLEVLRDRVHQIGVRNVLRDRVVGASPQRLAIRLLQPLPRVLDGGRAAGIGVSSIASTRAMR